MRQFSFVLLLGLTIAACGGSANSPAAPSSVGGTTPLSMTGTWLGTSTDSTGGEQMGVTLTQSGSTVTGTMSFADTTRAMMGNGTMQGALSGNTMTFHMAIPSGGFNGSMSPCSMSMDGTATISTDGMTMTGTYGGQMSGMMSGMMSQQQSCGGAMTNGQFTMKRQ
jgi:hypothetical protein